MLQQEEQREAVNITRVEMCESLMEEMAAEEQEVMEECKAAERQRVHWADRRKRGRSGQSGEGRREVQKWKQKGSWVMIRWRKKTDQR